METQRICGKNNPPSPSISLVGFTNAAVVDCHTATHCTATGAGEACTMTLPLPLPLLPSLSSFAVELTIHCVAFWMPCTCTSSWWEVEPLV